jgi:hypothetical protein
MEADDDPSLVQPGLGTTYIHLEAYRSNYGAYQAQCAGCTSDLTLRLNTFATQPALFTQTSAGQTQNVKLNLDFALVPPAKLTGTILVKLSANRAFWKSRGQERRARSQGGHQKYSEIPRRALLEIARDKS